MLERQNIGRAGIEGSQRTTGGRSGRQGAGKALARREEEKDYEVLDERRIGLTAAAFINKNEPGRCQIKPFGN